MTESTSEKKGSGGIAHDLNNLLTIIKGHAEFLSRALPDEGMMREDIDQILNTSDKAIGLVRQLLLSNREQAALRAQTSPGDDWADPSEDVPEAHGTELVLLVDDEDEVRAVSRRMLLTHGYQVVEAKDGVDALSVLDGLSKGIDILVTDVVMPRMDGVTLTRQLRAKMSDLPVVVVSGHTDEQLNSYKIAKLGVTFIPKPFPAKDLLRAVRSALDK